MTLAIFLPASFFAILANRFMDALGDALRIRAGLKGVGGAVVSAILAAIVRQAEGAIVDVAALLIVLGTGLLPLRLQPHTPSLIGDAGLAGPELGLAGTT